VELFSQISQKTRNKQKKFKNFFCLPPLFKKTRVPSPLKGEGARVYMCVVATGFKFRFSPLIKKASQI
jgi:hypothetical protein